MNIRTVVALSLLELAVVVSAGHELLLKYRFSASLDPEGQYKLYWSYNLTAQTVSFAVQVKTTGWVGFGISPSGGMVGSDVVIGWVESNGAVQFHVRYQSMHVADSVRLNFLCLQDRYAEQQALPSIDASQDWFLVSGEEENGFTVLEFNRNLTSCDDRDLNIGVSTIIIIDYLVAEY